MVLMLLAKKYKQHNQKKLGNRVLAMVTGLETKYDWCGSQNFYAGRVNINYLSLKNILSAHILDIWKPRNEY